MDFSEVISALSERALKLKASLQTEEATKTALILPFIKALGYDIFNPLEVVPEFIADIPGMKGEKVDYAIIHEGKPSIMIECKSCGVNLNEVKFNQLHRYFVTQDSIVAILTDGIRYMFFAKDAEGKKWKKSHLWSSILKRLTLHCFRNCVSCVKAVLICRKRLKLCMS